MSLEVHIARNIDQTLEFAFRAEILSTGAEDAGVEECLLSL